MEWKVLMNCSYVQFADCFYGNLVRNAQNKTDHMRDKLRQIFISKLHYAKLNEMICANKGVLSLNKGKSLALSPKRTKEM